MNKKINNKENYLSAGLITPKIKKKKLIITIEVGLDGALNLYSNYLSAGYRR
jgi:hypothetical protein